MAESTNNGGSGNSGGGEGGGGGSKPAQPQGPPITIVRGGRESGVEIRTGSGSAGGGSKGKR